MKVFISWSGDFSKKVALSVKAWIENTLQNVSAFMSQEDIDKGTFWFNAISDSLKDTTIGILCLTAENKNSPWILFEAGALSKGLSKNRVCPLLIDLVHSDLGQPLSQFNGSYPTKDDMEKIIQLINKETMSNGLPEHRVKASFEMWWPKFSEELQEIIESKKSSPAQPKPSMDEKVTEILELSRSFQKQMQSLVIPENSALNPFGWNSAEQAMANFYQSPFEQRGLLGNWGAFTNNPIVSGGRGMTGVQGQGSLFKKQRPKEGESKDGAA